MLSAQAAPQAQPTTQAKPLDLVPVNVHVVDRAGKAITDLKESDFNYSEMMRALKEFKARGRVILESPVLEQDALMLRKLYNEI